MRGLTRMASDSEFTVKGGDGPSQPTLPAVDQWKNWADGRDVRSADLVQLASTLEDHDEIPGMVQLGESLARWAEAQGVELQPPSPPMVGFGLEL
jgi:hypothetical protein